MAVTFLSFLELRVLSKSLVYKSSLYIYIYYLATLINSLIHCKDTKMPITMEDDNAVSADR